MSYRKRGTAVRIIYLLIAVLFFIINKIRSNPPSGTIVLCYHGVKDAEQEQFSRQMHIIGRRAIAIKDLNNIQKHDQQVSRICITFDDAFANLISNVLPTINKLQIPITIFIATKSIGSFPTWLNGTKHPDVCEMVMTVPQILALKENPFVTFGSHTANHLRLSQLQKEKIREELRSSRETLEDLLSMSIDTLALPHGDYNKEVLQIAIEEGYKDIYTLEPVPYIAQTFPIDHTIGRFSVSPNVWEIEFILTCLGAYNWLAGFRLYIYSIIRWILQFKQNNSN